MHDMIEQMMTIMITVGDPPEGAYTLHHSQSFFISFNLIMLFGMHHFVHYYWLSTYHRMVPYQYRANEEFFSDASSSCYKVNDSFSMIINYVEGNNEKATFDRSKKPVRRKHSIGNQILKVHVHKIISYYIIVRTKSH